MKGYKFERNDKMAAKKSMEMERDKKICEEIDRLNDILKNIHESKRKIAKSLIENIAFMAVILEDMQADIKQKGATIETTNGNGFKVITENPTMKSYNTTINRFTTATKQLFDLLPKDLPSVIPEQDGNGNGPKDELQSFLEKHNKK